MSENHRRQSYGYDFRQMQKRDRGDTTGRDHSHASYMDVVAL